MITAKEQERIYLLSDEELYEQAVQFMGSIGRTLPPTQVNGLLNVALDNTYDQLNQFLTGQYNRKTWPFDAQHVKEFYFKLPQQLKRIEAYIPSITRGRAGKLSREDEQTLKTLLAREFIQHLLAENAYLTRKASEVRQEEKPHNSSRGYRDSRSKRRV